MAARAALLIAIISIGLSLSAAPPAAAVGWDIPFELRNGMIIVEGTLGSAGGLRFLIDTASTCSLVDKTLAKKLHLHQEPGECTVRAFGQVTKAKRFCLPGLKIGPVFTSLHALEADLSPWMIDGVIGLDLLRRKTWLASCETHEVISDKNLTIDFESLTIRFGQSEPLPHSAALEAYEPQIVVPVEIYGRTYRLVLDTGASTIILFEGSKMYWKDNLEDLQPVCLTQISGTDVKKELQLPPLVLGTCRWECLRGVMMAAADRPLDGLLAVAALRLKKLHLDLDHNLVSWSR